MHDSPVQRLLHRWFVQYNPTYLLSAVLVFVGCFLWSRSVVHQGALGTFGIPFVVELYAAALIGGAALLTRLGQRRTAVILALITLVYQWDTTLHTDACVYLGTAGRLAAVLWFAIFVAKLFALTWALRIRLQRQAWLAAIVAALGFVVLPNFLAHVGPRAAGALLAVWMFVLCSFDRGGSIECGALDASGEAVRSRVTRAAWLMSGVFVGLHAMLWCMNARVSEAPIVLALPLLAVRRVRSELGAWALVGSVLAIAILFRPDAVSATALVSAIALALRVLAPRFADVRVPAPAPARPVPEPYRADVAAPMPPPAPPSFVPAPPLDAAERARAISGALFAGYLATWTLRHSQGSFPAHVLALDLAWTMLAVVAVLRTGRRAPFIVPLALSYVHAAVGAGLVPTPRSAAEWGEAAVALGFVVLGSSLFVSWRLRGIVPHGDTPAGQRSG